MPMIVVLIAGALFGAGVTVSGMVNPMKVLNFMDIAGTWDPTLIFVMGGGLATALIGYRMVFRQAAPWYAPDFTLPRTTGIDARLIGGSALFGIGWGLAGFCPGPAIASLIFGHAESAVFVIAMALGMGLVKLASAPPSPAGAAGEGKP